MKRIILFALLSVPVLFWLFRYFPASFFFFAVGFLATAVYFVVRVVRPWHKERTTQKPGPSYQFHKYISLISLLSLIAGASLFIIFSIQPGPPAPLQGHTNQVNIVAFDSAADRLASGGVDGSIRLWSVPENRFIRSFPDKGETLYAKYDKFYTSIAYSLDGNLIAFGSSDQTIRVWDVKKNVVLYQLTGHTGSVNALAFSPDGKWLASGGEDKIVRLWRVGDGTLARKLEKHTNGVTSLAFNGAGDYLASGSSDTTAVLWQVSNGALLAQFGGFAESVIGVAFGRDPTFIKDKETLLAVSAKGILRRWPVDDPKNYREMFKERASDITVVSFSRDGFYMASADSEKGIRIWLTVPVPSNLPTPIVTPNIPVTPTPPYAPKSTLKKQNEIVTSLAFDPTGKILAYAGKDHWIHTWNVPDGLALKDFDQGIEVKAITFSPDGNSIAAARIDETVRVLDKNGGNELAKYEVVSRDVRQLAFSQDGANLVSVSRDGYIRNWQIQDSKLLYERKTDPDQISSIAINANDSKQVAVGLIDGSIQIWQLNGGEPRTIGARGKAISSLAYSPSGLIASGSIDEPIRVWTPEGKQVIEIPGPGGESTSLVFSPEGKALASASSDKTVILSLFADASSAELINRISLPVQPFAVTTMKFSKDGSALATGSWDNTIRLWKVSDGTLIDELPGYAQPIKSLGITKDNAIWAAGMGLASSDIRVWRAGDFQSIVNPISTYSLNKLLLGSEAGRIFLAYCFGVLLAIGIVLLPIYSFSGISARFLLSQYRGFDIKQARWAVFAIQLGIRSIVQTVSAGKLQTTGPVGVRAQLGGPGLLFVEEGHAVVLMRGGMLSRVVGCGITSLKKFERVSLVIYLGLIREPFQVRDLVTKDKVVLQSIDLYIDYKINPGNEAIRNGAYPFDMKVILNTWKVWYPQALGTDDKNVAWNAALQIILNTATRDVIAQYELADMITAAGEMREEIKQRVRVVLESAAEQIGLSIIGVDVGVIAFPGDAQEKLLERWKTDWEAEITRIKATADVAKAEAEYHSSIAKAEASKIAKMVEGEGEAYALKAKEVARAEAAAEKIRQVGAVKAQGYLDNESFLGLIKYIFSEDSSRASRNGQAQKKEYSRATSSDNPKENNNDDNSSDQPESKES